MKTILITTFLLFTTIGFGQSIKKQCKTLYQQLEVKLEEEKVLREEYGRLYLDMNANYFGMYTDSTFLAMKSVQKRLTNLEQKLKTLMSLEQSGFKFTPSTTATNLNRQILDSLSAQKVNFYYISEIPKSNIELKEKGKQSNEVFLIELTDLDKRLNLLMESEKEWIKRYNVNMQYVRLSCSIFERLKPKYLAQIAELENLHLDDLLANERSKYQQKGPTGFSEKYEMVFPDVFPKNFDTYLPISHGDFVPKSNEKIEENMRSEEPLILDIVDISAEFPGGREAMIEFLKININVPSIVTNNRLSGKVVLKFVVSSSGNISNVRVQKGMPDCEECDSEAQRVIRMMPNWIPAKTNGKPVNSWYTIPLRFEY